MSLFVRRPQFQVRHLMIAVLACALLATGLRASEEWRGLFLIVSGPVFGSLIHQSIGGRGILGGAIGGGVFGIGFGIFAYFFSGPVNGGLIDLFIGIPAFSLVFAIFGLVVGAVMWGLKIQIEDKDSPYPWWSPPVDSSKPNRPNGQ